MCEAGYPLSVPSTGCERWSQPCHFMKLTREQIEEAQVLEKAVREYYESTRLQDDEEDGLLFSAGNFKKAAEKIHAVDASDQHRDFGEFLRVLSDQELREMHAIMWIGKGIHSPSDFQKACDEAGPSATREQDVEYLEGLAANGYFAAGIEKLKTARVI